MSVTRTGTGLKRLQHLVLWVANVDRSVRFYCDVVGFEIQRRYPNAAFLKIPGTPDDHNLGLFEQTGVPRPDERVARMYHSAWEVERPYRPRPSAPAPDRRRGSGRIVESRREPVALRQGSRRPRVRDLLDGPGWGVCRAPTELDLEGELADRGLAIP